jgi:hypothetical protein
MRCHLINTPLQRGDCGARNSELFEQFLLYPRSAEPLKRFRPTRSLDTQLKLGVNEKQLSDSLLQSTS